MTRALLTFSAVRVVVAYTLPVVVQVPTHLVLRPCGHWHALFARARRSLYFVDKRPGLP